MFRSLIGGVARQESRLLTKALPRNTPNSIRCIGDYRASLPKLRHIRFSSTKSKHDTVSSAESAQDALMNAPLTPQEKVSASFYLGLLGLGSVCFVFTVIELWPTSMSPNSVFDEAFNQVRKSAEVVSSYGEPLKAYGIDSGGHREGRRNFIQSREYEAEDGSKRIKVRFNLQGQYAGGIVFAEVSDKMDTKNGEWVYLIVQSKKTGQAITLCDNRQALEAASYAKSPEEKEAVRRLLKGTESF